MSTLRSLLYLLLVAGVTTAVSTISAHALAIAAALIALADLLLEHVPLRQALREQCALRWPWQTPAFWIVPIATVVVAATLLQHGVESSTVAWVCGSGLLVHGYRVACQMRRVCAGLGTLSVLGPSCEDWAVFLCTLSFCVLGIWLLTQDWRVGIVTCTLFGLVALTFGAKIARQLRIESPPVLATHIVGSTTLFAERRRLLPAAASCITIGCVLYFVGTSYPLLLRVMGGFIALTGCVVLARMALGLYSSRFIRFEPQALWVGEQSYRFKIDWDNIGGIATLAGANDAVIVRIADLERIEVQPPRRRSHFLRDLTCNSGWLQSHLVLRPESYGLDVAACATALARYAAQADVRQELAAHRATGSRRTQRNVTLA